MGKGIKAAGLVALLLVALVLTGYIKYAIDRAMWRHFQQQEQTK